VRSGDSGSDSPKVHRPRGWIIGPGRGVDKGDEFVMQLGGELLRLDSYMAPPVRIQASPHEDPDFLRTWFLPARRLTNVWPLPARSQTISAKTASFALRPLPRSSLLRSPQGSISPRKVRSLGRKLTPAPYLPPRLSIHHLSPACLPTTLSLSNLDTLCTSWNIQV